MRLVSLHRQHRPAGLLEAVVVSIVEGVDYLHVVLLLADQLAGDCIESEIKVIRTHILLCVVKHEKEPKQEGLALLIQTTLVFLSLKILH